MTYIKETTKKKTAGMHKRLPLLVFAITGLLMGSYLVGVGVVTSNVIERKEIQKEIRETTSRLSVLEEEYITSLEVVNKELAYSLGYETPRTMSYSTQMTFADARSDAYEI
ncbi:MAG: hypothetical protein ACI9AR_000507 [Flavobacteriaceae bacterium]|jgi:hypothetical protein